MRRWGIWYWVLLIGATSWAWAAAEARYGQWHLQARKLGGKPGLLYAVGEVVVTGQRVGRVQAEVKLTAPRVTYQVGKGPDGKTTLVTITAESKVHFEADYLEPAAAEGEEPTPVHVEAEGVYALYREETQSIELRGSPNSPVVVTVTYGRGESAQTVTATATESITYWLDAEAEIELPPE
ncbi:MAG TPA: hypothetical protein EYP85_00015 [Armatimonadetes bacterium]|nr:hypothetical protein [Armatimonadota bacterium]